MKKHFFSVAAAAILFGTSFMPSPAEAINLPYSTTAKQKVLCYLTAGGTQKGWIDPGDNIIIKSINGSWAFVNYPTSSGRVERWCPLTQVYSGTGVNGINLPYSTIAKKHIICYLSPGGQQKGYIDAGDNVTIKLVDGNWALVNYPTSSGRVERWCVLSDIYTPSTPERNIPNIVINNPTIIPVVRDNYVKLADGFYKIASVKSNKYLNANSTGILNGVNICIYDKIPNNCQIFYLENQSDGYFTLKASYTDLYLDAQNGASTNGTNVQLYEGNGTNAQRWRLIDAGNGSYYIVTKLMKDQVFDCAGGGTTNGTNVQLWKRENLDRNKWKFEKMTVPKAELPGDVNSDWKVDNNDLNHLMKYLAKSTARINKLNADLNGNGTIDLTDVSQLNLKLNSATYNTPSIPKPAVKKEYAKRYVFVFGNESLQQPPLKDKYLKVGEDYEVLEERNNALRVRFYNNTRTNQYEGWVTKDVRVVDNTSYQWPITNGTPALNTIYRYSENYNPPLSPHRCRYKASDGRPFGVDIEAAWNENVFSIAGGTVEFSGKDGSGFGNYIIILHDNGVRSLYAHLNGFASGISSSKTNPVRVSKGQLIGYVGNSGLGNTGTNGKHLHFEMSSENPWIIFQNQGLKFKYNYSSNSRPW